MSEHSAKSTLTHLQRLEAEAIHIIREVVAEAERPVMLYSVGKDCTRHCSTCLRHRANQVNRSIFACEQSPDHERGSTINR